MSEDQRNLQRNDAISHGRDFVALSVTRGLAGTTVSAAAALDVAPSRGRIADSHHRLGRFPHREDVKENWKMSDLVYDLSQCPSSRITKSTDGQIKRIEYKLPNGESVALTLKTDVADWPL